MIAKSNPFPFGNKLLSIVNLALRPMFNSQGESFYWEASASGLTRLPHDPKILARRGAARRVNEARCCNHFATIGSASSEKGRGITEFWRERVGIEPTSRLATTSAILKTVRATRPVRSHDGKTLFCSRYSRCWIAGLHSQVSVTERVFILEPESKRAIHRYVRSPDNGKRNEIREAHR
jgi:hypothetical protein